MLQKLNYNTVIKVENQTEWEIVRSDEERIYSGIDYGFPKIIPYSPVFISLIRLISNTNIFPYYYHKPSTIAVHLEWEEEPNIVSMSEFLLGKMSYDNFIEDMQPDCEFSKQSKKETDAYFCQNDGGDIYCEYCTCPKLSDCQRSDCT